jgi:hypothetical protein
VGSAADSLRFPSEKCVISGFFSQKSLTLLNEERLERTERPLFHSALQALPSPIIVVFFAIRIRGFTVYVSAVDGKREIDIREPGFFPIERVVDETPTSAEIDVI